MLDLVNIYDYIACKVQIANVNPIRAYREQVGLSQEQMGEQIGVTRQTLAAWEKGERAPSLVQLVEITRVLGVAPELFFQPTTDEAPQPAESEAGLMFRADQPSALTSFLRAHLTQKATDYAIVEQFVGELPALPELRPLLGYDEYMVEEVADEVRDWLGVGEACPLGDVLTLLESKGLKVIRYPLPNSISGFSAYTDTWGGVVFINENHPTERQFFTALHELGHLIFHRQEYKDIQERSHKNDPQEKAANHLASAVLLSGNIVRRELRAYRNCWLPEPLLADMKLRYGVSMRTVLYRSAQLGLISQKQKGQQLEVLSKKYGTEHEEHALSKPMSLTRLERLVYLALIKEKLTTSRVAEILGKSLIEVRQDLNAWMEEEPG